MRRKRRIRKSTAAIILAIALILIGAALVLIVTQAALAGSREVMAQADAFLLSREAAARQQDKSAGTGSRTYSRNLELIGKVVCFEVGYCDEYDQYLVASACYNRMTYWYGGDALRMIQDGNDEYYYMYPGYAWMSECNGISFREHYDEIMEVVWKAAKNPADVWYWDCEDSQGAWAELVEVTDAGYYYR